MYYILFGLLVLSVGIYFLVREGFGYDTKQYRAITEQEAQFGYHTKYSEGEFTPKKTSKLFMVCDQNIGTCFNQ